jgi:glutathione synthase/RimK-type ligase-like ATP-grasp enzyme
VCDIQIFTVEDCPRFKIHTFCLGKKLGVNNIFWLIFLFQNKHPLKMKILIIAIRNDAHLDAVVWGLKKMGHQPVVWYWSDFPCRDKSTFQLGTTGEAHLSITIDGISHEAPFDVIWNRRNGKPVSMKNSHPADMEVILRESTDYIQNILPFLGDEKTFWVNEPDAHKFAAQKCNQLMAARAIGFRIPDTLIGNDPEQVRQFFQKHDGKIVFKAFQGGVWVNEDGSETMLKTAAISNEHMANSFAMQACPGIYQQLLEKSYELRVTIMGHTILAAKLRSQENGRNIDWRFDGKLKELKLDAIDLPAEIQSKCLEFCARMGIVFGCIDIVVDKSGEYIFLEINPGGQFLWKEKSAPDILLLDTFCRFLASKNEQSHDLPDVRLHLSDYFNSDAYLLRLA